MENKLKAELEKLFDADKERAASVKQAASEQAEREAASLAKFERIRDQIIKPAMKEIADFASARGWHCQITARNEVMHPDKRLDRANITLSFSRLGIRASMQTPNFSVSCDKRDDSADFYESTIGDGHGGIGGGTGSIKLDSITGEVIQGRLVKYIEKLLKDAKPSPYSR